MILDDMMTSVYFFIYWIDCTVV